MEAEVKMIKNIHEQLLTWFPEIKEMIQSLFEKGFNQSEKKDFRDLVSDIDLATEKLIISKITAMEGEQTLLAEESHTDTLEVDADRLGSIAPIDGSPISLVGIEDYYFGSSDIFDEVQYGVKK